MTFRELAVLALCAAATGLGSVSAQSPPDAATLAARVQQRLATVRDFSGTFVQTYEGGVLRKKATERGTMSIKRPGRMRWSYSAPDRKEFVSDGARLYTYLVLDKQVIVSPAPGDGENTTPALFLAGKTNLTTDFTASIVELPGAPAGLLGLKLVPRATDPGYAWMALGVDPGTYQVRYLAAADRQEGLSTFTFGSLKENAGLADKDFEFRIPKGVDVVTNSARER